MTEGIPKLGAASPIMNNAFAAMARVVAPGISSTVNAATAAAEVASSIGKTSNFGAHNAQAIAQAGNPTSSIGALATSALSGAQTAASMAARAAGIQQAFGGIGELGAAADKLFAAMKKGDGPGKAGGGQDKQSVASAGKTAEQEAGRSVADASTNNTTQDLAKLDQTDKATENSNATETNSITDTNEQTQVAMTDEDKPGQADWEAAGALDGGNDTEMA